MILKSKARRSDLDGQCIATEQARGGSRDGAKQHKQGNQPGQAPGQQAGTAPAGAGQCIILYVIPYNNVQFCTQHRHKITYNIVYNSVQYVQNSTLSTIRAICTICTI